MDPKIIAVDFDDTLCENMYPDIGEPKNSVIEYILEEQSKGSKIILWTCRTGVNLANAVDWCREHGIIFDAINDDLDSIKEKHGDTGKKIYADIYIDDKGVPPVFCKKGFRKAIRKIYDLIAADLIY